MHNEATAATINFRPGLWVNSIKLKNKMMTKAHKDCMIFGLHFRVIFGNIKLSTFSWTNEWLLLGLLVPNSEFKTPCSFTDHLTNGMQDIVSFQGTSFCY